MSSVDVVVPSYNHKQYVDRCVNSILAQSFDNVNIIIIDDGSSDGSAAYLDQTYSKEERVNVYLQSNIGLTRTLNRAIFEFCTAKYVVFIASDDILLPERLSKQVAFMEQNEMMLSYADHLVIDKDENTIGNGVKQKLAGHLFDKLFLGEYNIPACTCIYRLDVLKEFNGFNADALVEDSDMYLKVASKYPIGYLDEIVTLYRRHGNNMSKTMTTAIFHDAVKRIDRFQDHPLYQKARRNLVLPALINLCKSGDRISALKLAWQEKPEIWNKRFWIALYYFLSFNRLYDPYSKY